MYLLCSVDEVSAAWCSLLAVVVVVGGCREFRERKEL